MKQYISADPDDCLRKGHHFRMFGANKTPLLRHLECVTCTAACGMTVVVAYGDMTKSWGNWRIQRYSSHDDERAEHEMSIHSESL